MDEGPSVVGTGGRIWVDDSGSYRMLVEIGLSNEEGDAIISKFV